MNNFKFSQRSLNNLKGVHPLLVQLCQNVLSKSPYDIGILQGVRTVEQQKINMANGASQTMNSRHLPRDIMYQGKKINVSCAIDFSVFVNGKLTWDNKYYTEVVNVFKAEAQKMNIEITCGDDWKMRDSGHIQLSWNMFPAVR